MYIYVDGMYAIFMSGITACTVVCRGEIKIIYAPIYRYTYLYAYMICI